MQELHIPIKGHCTRLLNRIAQLKVVSFLEQNRRVVDEHSVQDGHNCHLVLDHSRLDLVRNVVVDRVLHVGWQEMILQPLVVQLIIIEYLDHHCEHPGELVGIEAHLKHLVVLLTVVIHDEIEHFLNQGNRVGKHEVGESFAAENSVFHVLEAYILEAEYFLGVVVCNGCALHLTNLHLHDVFEETSTDQIVKLTLITAVHSFAFDYLIIQVINVAHNVVAEWGSSSRLDLKHYRVSVLIVSPSINLRSEEHLPTL